MYIVSQPIRETPSQPLTSLHHSRLLIPPLNSLPINHPPHRPKILRLPILILQIIRMLPRINPQQRPKLPHYRILVRVRLNHDRARLRILHQPRPARTLDPGERGVEFLLESGEGAVG